MNKVLSVWCVPSYGPERASSSEVSASTCMLALRPYPKECVDDHPDAWRCYTQWLDEAERVVSWTPEEMEPTVAMAVRQLPFYRSYTEKMARMAARQVRRPWRGSRRSSCLIMCDVPVSPPTQTAEEAVSLQ